MRTCIFKDDKMLVIKSTSFTKFRVRHSLGTNTYLKYLTTRVITIQNGTSTLARLVKEPRLIIELIQSFKVSPLCCAICMNQEVSPRQIILVKYKSAVHGPMRIRAVAQTRFPAGYRSRDAFASERSTT